MMIERTALDKEGASNRYRERVTDLVERGRGVPSAVAVIGPKN